MIDYDILFYCAGVKISFIIQDENLDLNSKDFKAFITRAMQKIQQTENVTLERITLIFKFENCVLDSYYTTINNDLNLEAIAASCDILHGKITTNFIFNDCTAKRLYMYRVNLICINNSTMLDLILDETFYVKMSDSSIGITTNFPLEDELNLSPEVKGKKVDNTLICIQDYYSENISSYDPDCQTDRSIFDIFQTSPRLYSDVVSTNEEAILIPTDSSTLWITKVECHNSEVAVFSRVFNCAMVYARSSCYLTDEEFFDEDYLKRLDLADDKLSNTYSYITPMRLRLNYIPCSIKDSNYPIHYKSATLSTVLVLQHLIGVYFDKN